MHFVTDYANIKAMIAAKNLAWQHFEYGTHYHLFAVDGAIVYSTDVYKDAVAPRGEDQAQHDTDRADWAASYQAISNKSIQRQNLDRASLVEIVPTRNGSGFNFYTPNVCMKCTWWEQSVVVTEATLTNLGDQLSYSAPDANIITAQHGRLFREDNILAAVPTLAVKVEVQVGGTGGWVEKVEKTLANGMVGDYDIAYDTGIFTFLSALDVSDNVRASYHRADGFHFTVAPAAGKMLKIYRAEMQFTEDVDINTIIRYQIWAYNPFDLPNKVFVQETAYKSMSDIVQESVGAYPPIPPLGGTNGFDKAVHIVRFEYPSVLPLYSSQGLELRVALDGDIAFGGTFANATIYCISDNE